MSVGWFIFDISEIGWPVFVWGFFFFFYRLFWCRLFYCRVMCCRLFCCRLFWCRLLYYRLYKYLMYSSLSSLYQCLNETMCHDPSFISYFLFLTDTHRHTALTLSLYWSGPDELQISYNFLQPISGSIVNICSDIHILSSSRLFGRIM